MVDTQKDVTEQTNQELVEILNLPTQNGSIKQYQFEAIKELRNRGQKPVIAGKDSEGYNIYGLEQK